MKPIASLLLVLLALNLCGQEIAGVINQYSEVTALDPCTGQLTLSDTTGFAPGQAVLLFQMQGATIADGNNSSFGDLVDLGGAGRYERHRILARDGDVITLENAILYDYDPDGAVQLVTLPELDDPVVTAPLTPAPWNGATGGVVALAANNLLTLEADIDASGAGFRGGASQIDAENDCNFLQNIDDYYFGLNNWRGALKGEGIAAFIGGREAGRGAQANGGGGGNDHNAGGGGGASAGAGGRGGNNDEPSFFGCDGEYPGIGGKILPAETDRAFLGGGGGGGHENNDVGTDGARGGGIVLLIADAIEGNGFTIRSNGLEALDATGDGAGGGGGGGALLIAANAVDNLNLEARGGAGGSVNNQGADRCFGPGGGGGGGQLRATLPLTADLSGGAAGTSFNSSDGGCNGANGAAAGQNGQTLLFDGVPASDQFIEAPAITDQPTSAAGCLGDPIGFSVITTGLVDTYQWQVDAGSGFSDLTDDGFISGAQTPTLNIGGLLSQIAGYSYRLVVSNNCGDTVTSEPITLELLPEPVADFSFTTFGLAVDFQNDSENADDFLWIFGDGMTSTVENPSYGYPATDDYTVSLIASNECGSDTLTTTVPVSNQPVANFITGTPTSGCAPLTVTFFNTSTNGVSYEWLFPGGSPASSTDFDGTVTYNAAGDYDVTLIAFNGQVYDTLTVPAIVEVEDVPTPGFTVDLDGGLATFTNTSINADSYEWNFGDNSSSVNPNPTHTYAGSGAYPVTLTAFNACGSSTFTETLTVNLQPIAAFTADITGGCAPLAVTFNSANTINADSYFWLLPGATPATAGAANPSVLYTEPGSYDVTLIVNNDQGADTLTLAGFIAVEGLPAANFGFDADDLTVNFTNSSTDADDYLWQFEAGATSTALNPSYTFPAPGPYPVTLTATNECGSDVITIEVTAGTPPQAAFTGAPLSGCLPVTVQFSSQSTGPVDTYNWSFPGGTPSASNDPNPSVSYAAPGQYPVTLTVSGVTGASTFTADNLVSVFVLPTPAFDYTVDGNTVTFTNLSTNATDYFWDFGDGNTSFETDPVHTFATDGFYQVTLNALTPACGNATSQNIVIQTTATGEQAFPELRVFPNPVREMLFVEWASEPREALQIRLLDATGRVIIQRVQPTAGNLMLSVKAVPAGLYFLELTGRNGRRVLRVVRE